MEVDSVHSMIERTKKTTPVYAPSQWYTIARMARRNKPYNVTEMLSSDFLNFKLLATKGLKNLSKDANGNIVQWMNIKHLCYMKNQPDAIFFKYNVESAELGTILTSQTRGKITPVSQLPVANLYACQECPRISTAKYNDLQDLCRSLCIPKDYHAFYESLPRTSTVSDVLPEPDIDDDSDCDNSG